MLAQEHASCACAARIKGIHGAAGVGDYADFKEVTLYLQQQREEKSNFAERITANKGTDTSINAAKLNELVFLNHS